MAKKVRVGVFGADRGMTMMTVLRNYPDAELVAVCDKYEPLLDSVKKLAEENGLNVALYTDFEDFFRHEMDAVILANYANEHAPFAVRLLRSGRHVMSEVLPCENMAQAVELIEAVEETGKVYTYAENYCYMWHTFEMWRRYRQGDIGEIRYGEGEYVHDCVCIWPQVSYGERDHWRNWVFPTFYCTHSCGPLLAISGLRPVKVTGYVMQASAQERAMGTRGGGVAVEMITLENGAVVKSLHGALKREPGSVNYEVYGTKGCMESQRYGDTLLNVWIEKGLSSHGDLETYRTKPFIEPERARDVDTHGGSDFYPTHFFIQKILGNPEADKWAIDVYRAVDMGICGILAYRSVLNGGAPVEVPDLRDPAQREKYRHDIACTNPRVAGDQLWPTSPEGTPDIPQEQYDKVRKLWQEGKEGGYLFLEE